MSAPNSFKAKLTEFSGNRNRRNRIFLTILFFFCSLSFMLCYIITSPSHMALQTIQSLLSNSTYDDVSNLLNETPYLWRRFDIDFSNLTQDNHANRVEQQRQWIVGLSRTNFVQEVRDAGRMKLILLENSDPHHVSAELSVKCPYAPEFTALCHLIMRNYTDLSSGLLNMRKSIWEIGSGKVAAIVSPRNGYWGLKEVALGGPGPGPESDVIQIFYTQESPCHTNPPDLGKNQAWLGSYWRGSDIPVYYNTWKKFPGRMNDEDWETTKQILLQRRNPVSVAALISNCDFIKNGRLSYIEELQKYIPVDIYGKCGPKMCAYPDLECQADLGRSYKFFLAFENCNCVDYVTEKPHVNALLNNMTAVVMGAPRFDYESLLPPNSFIHVDDFKNPEELATYLTFLGERDEEYLKLWEWRRDNWTLSLDSQEDFFCRICGMLFYNEFVPAPKWNSSLVTFKDVNKCQSQPDQKWSEYNKI